MMKMTTKLGVVLSTCLVLGGCEELLTEPGADSTETTETTQTNLVSNGYYRSRIVVNHADGEVKQDTNFRINEDRRTLTSEDYVVQRLSPIPPNEYARYEYDENGNLTRHRLEQYGGVEQFDKYFVYDDEGKLISLTDATANGSEFKEVYTYNANGQLAFRSRDVATEGSVGGQRVWQYVYDAAGNLESMSNDQPSVPGPGDITYFYHDEEGRLIESQLDSAFDGTIDMRREYRYDDTGNLLMVIRYNSWGEFLDQTVYSYTATDTNVFNESLFNLKYYPQ